MWFLSVIAALVNAGAAACSTLSGNVPMTCINLALFAINLYLALAILRERKT